MKEIRFKIHDVLYKRFKHLCVENDLKLSNQVLELIRKFVEIQEENMSIMKRIRK